MAAFAHEDIGVAAALADAFAQAALALTVVITITDAHSCSPTPPRANSGRFAGRAMSRHAATKRWGARRVVDDLAARGILICSPSLRGVAEEAPGAYKDGTKMVDAGNRRARAQGCGSVVCVKG